MTKKLRQGKMHVVMLDILQYHKLVKMIKGTAADPKFFQCLLFKVKKISFQFYHLNSGSPVSFE